MDPLPASARDAALRDWQGLHDSGDIQFAPVPPVKPPETPGWLEALGRWLADVLGPLGKWLGMSWPVMQWVLIALAVLLTLGVLWFLLRPLVERMRTRRVDDVEEGWVPDHAAAQALLEDADRLAAEGRFDEAVHLLLRRSVGHIAERRPDWLLPASTAREIATFPMLPAAARTAFAVIAARVERSLYALRHLDEADWQASRRAYSDFALAGLTGPGLAG
ncbi:MAG TPA: hypothetical protein VJM34_07630 [Novosphingobium sp.]|nr:hypothetical protein [Novosphingobium sp.]